MLCTLIVFVRCKAHTSFILTLTLRGGLEFMSWSCGVTTQVFGPTRDSCCRTKATMSTRCVKIIMKMELNASKVDGTRVFSYFSACFSDLWPKVYSQSRPLLLLKAELAKKRLIKTTKYVSFFNIQPSFNGGSDFFAESSSSEPKHTQ